MTRHTARWITALFFLALPVMAQAGVLRVSPTGSNNGGYSWLTAYQSVQPAIDAAAPGDHVWVSAGTYVENITLKEGVSLYGGFSGNEVNLQGRNPKTFETVIDGGRNGAVVYAPPGVTTATLIDGFTLRNGTGKMVDYVVSGGGICALEASPRISNNVIRGNEANFGGGIYLRSSSAEIVGNRIEGNVARAYEGSGAYGGGIMVQNFSAQDAIPVISGNTVTDNRSDNQIGGICVWHCSPRITNNVIMRNEASAGWAGGIQLSDYFEGTEVIGNVIAYNIAGPGGDAGGLHLSGGRGGVVANNTIYMNPAVLLAVRFEWVSGTRFVNNIVQGSTGGVEAFAGSTPVVDYNILNCGAGAYSGIVAGAHDIFADPQLSPDLHLIPGSPAIDAGDSSAASTIADFEGDPRVIGSAIDIGADEFPAPLVTFVDSNSPGPAFDGKSWGTAFHTIQEGLEAATAGNEVWVAKGLYVENITLKDGVALYGGFGGGASTKEERNASVNETVITSNHNGQIVMLRNGVNPATRIDGFTIFNGSPVYIPTDPVRCGGITIINAALTVENNRISGNTNGGICSSGSWVRVIGNSVTDSSSGAGIAEYENRSSEIRGNYVSGNQLYTWGVGIRVVGTPGAIIEQNLVENNESIAYSGGGIYVERAAATVRRNLVRNNRAGAGAGIMCEAGSSGTLVANNIVTGNTAQEGAGVFIGYGVTAHVTNNTIALNTATSGGGIFFNTLSNAMVTNNIVAFNSNAFAKANYGGYPTLRFNDVFGNPGGNYGVIAPGTGDISVDPLFYDSAAGDFHLKSSSPLIDAGDTGGAGTELLDYDGESRIVNGSIDIGADEFSYPATEMTVTGTLGANGWHISAVQVAFAATDAEGGSGIAATNYSLDGGATWQQFLQPFELVSGVTKLMFRSVTSDGRTEAAKRGEVKIDQYPPTVAVATAGTSGENGWFVSDVTVSAVSSDGTGSGVATVECSADGTTWTPYASAFAISGEGSATVICRATDVAGLVGSSLPAAFSIDKTAPATSVTVTGALGENNWYRSAVQVALTASDGHSGVARTEYSLDSGIWTTYAGEVTVTQEGSHSLQLRSFDRAGNTEAVKAVSFGIDTSAPNVTATSPANGATGVPIGNTITVTFSEDIQPGAEFANIRVSGGKTPVSFAATVLGNTLTLDPNLNMPKNTPISVTIPAMALKDKAGNSSTPHSFGFRTGSR